MDDFYVNSYFVVVVSDDEDVDGVMVRFESFLEVVLEWRLVNDGEVLFDIIGFGYGDDGVILYVKDVVLFEDGVEYGLDNDVGGGVGDEVGFFMELFGEEVNIEVVVLVGGSRGVDVDDLVGVVLED